MDIFAIDLTPTELSVLRQSLELITITGKDAKFIANLQIKLENEMTEIQNIKTKQEQKKQKELQEVLKAEAKKQNQ